MVTQYYHQYPDVLKYFTLCSQFSDTVILSYHDNYSHDMPIFTSSYLFLYLGNITMDTHMSDTFMLLVDMIGYKSSKSWIPRAPVEERVHRGTLMVGLTEAEAKETKQYYNPTLNYKTLSSEHLIQLFCSPKEVYPLTVQQKQLLIGIKSTFDRYRMTRSLQWAEKLTVGDGVHINIKSIHSPVRGTIRYIGNLPEEDGTKFGVEMLVSAKLWTFCFD